MVDYKTHVVINPQIQINKVLDENTLIVRVDSQKDGAKIKEKISKYIEENINIINTSVVLVFVEEEAETKQELYKTIDKFGNVCKFDFQKPIQIEKRIKAICNSYKVKIDDSTLRYFIECCGTNMQDLINEIRKLIEYAGENGKIERIDIDKLSIKKLESIIFDLTDSLGKKDTKKALEVLKNLVYAKEPIQKILTTDIQSPPPMIN